MSTNCQSAVKRASFVALTILLLGSVVCGGLLSRTSRSGVEANLTANDLAEIRSAVRHDVRDKVLGASGMRNYRKIPAWVSYRLSHQIGSIKKCTNGTAVVIYQRSGLRGDMGYVLTKGTNGWKITTELFH